MNPAIGKLHRYPFARLNELLGDLEANQRYTPIRMSIGEPRHRPPAFVSELLGRAEGLGQYPPINGSEALRRSAAAAMTRRFSLADSYIQPNTMVIPVNGTREALFSFIQAVVGGKTAPAVVMPNPFYQIYEGATLLAGAEPIYLNTLAENNFIPDLTAISDSIWERCELLLLCSPGNPTGAVLSRSYLLQALALADKFDFIVAVDECYSDIYRNNQAPDGLLSVCANAGRENFERCAVFHSLSKRSNVPGLRSGIVICDPDIAASYRLYRTYHGCAMPPSIQLASIALWNDDNTPAMNRKLYDQKFEMFTDICKPDWPLSKPAGAFYVWAEVPGDDLTFTRSLYADYHVTVLPGRFLARKNAGVNPGDGWVRLSLVEDIDICREAAHRIVDLMHSRN